MANAVIDTLRHRDDVRWTPCHRGRFLSFRIGQKWSRYGADPRYPSCRVSERMILLPSTLSASNSQQHPIEASNRRETSLSWTKRRFLPLEKGIAGRQTLGSSLRDQIPEWPAFWLALTHGQRGTSWRKASCGREATLCGRAVEARPRWSFNSRQIQNTLPRLGVAKRETGVRAASFLNMFLRLTRDDLNGTPV